MKIKAKKSLGQNFLVNPHILDRIISAAEISDKDTIIEVGPGTGNLTKKLAEKAGKVIAVEKDSRLIEPLKEFFKGNPNVSIIEADILEFLPKESNYKIVANIPYYITSNFLRAVFEKWPRPKMVVLTIQKEVAARIIAKPPRMNLLALSIQYYSEPELITNISKNNFRPVPKVDSAVIRLRSKPDISDPEQSQIFFKLIKTGFSEKRKQLASTLSKKLKLDKDKIEDILAKEGMTPGTRPESLSIEQWQKLSLLLPR